MKEDNKYQSINQRINESLRYYRVPSEVEKNAALNSLLNKIGTTAPRKSKTIISPLWVKTSAGIAAAVFFAVVFWVVLAKENIKNTGNEVVSLRLPDHSRVILADKSSVSYHNYFWNRKIRLKGKAYFEVEKGSRFRVLTSGGMVEVLGTRFMVDGKKDQFEVICFEGKVKASFHHSDALLPAGSGVKFSGDKEPDKLKAEEAYPGFARFSANYNNTELGVVLKDMEKFFGVRIDNQTRKKRFFTGSVNTGNLDYALTILTGSLQLEYNHQGGNTIRIY